MIMLAFLIGIVAGLRAFTPVAAVSWASYLGWLHVRGTWLGFLGHPAAAYIFSALALVELVTDKLPVTPSRKVPMQFGARIVLGALCGAAVGISGQSFLGVLMAGVVGAIAGTLGGAATRARLAKALGKDLPAALIEDIVAVSASILLIWSMK
jgi:uncharacterized membrane protein